MIHMMDIVNKTWMKKIIALGFHAEIETENCSPETI